jgi:hypothetical protein
MQWTWRRPANYQRRLASVQDQYRLAEVKRERLALLGQHTLDNAEALTAREAALVEQPPASAERYQYLVDAVTRGFGDVIADLVRRWAEQR